MTAQIIDGKAIAARVREEVKERAAAFARAHGRPPGLEVVLCGDDPASHVYVRNKEKAAAEAGIAGKVHRLGAETTQGDLEALVERLNADAAVDGILVQLPLPRHLDAQPVLDRIDPGKDVDGLHPTNAGLLAVEGVGREQIVHADVATIRAAARLLDRYEEIWRGRIDRIDDLLREEPGRTGT